MPGSKRITISFPEEDEYLLDEIDNLVQEGVYDDRTDAIINSISETENVDRTTLLYDAAVSSLYSAERQGKSKIAENAKRHILEKFPGSKMADLLEE